ncbi:MAG: glucokinase [Alphaproteobacteria bacterium]|nr:glucokinase [Alphaproteobacteria bacterium]
MNENKILVGDVGGTHARFAVVDVSQVQPRIEERADIDSGGCDNLEDALKAYLAQAGAERPQSAAIAVAGPVTNGRVHLTNRGWDASEDNLRKFGFRRAFLINDFAALAFSVAALNPNDCHTIGPEQDGLPEEPITIVGAGTGFGVSCLARYRGRAVPIATEGGHMSFAPNGEAQTAVLRALAKRFPHVSIERVLSGPGLENLYGALEEIAGRKPKPLAAEEISRRAEAGDAACQAAQNMFCAIYGAVAGDFALAHGARGGVYIAGGIAAKIEQYLQRSDFRKSFEDKGRLSSYLKPIPTKLIIGEDAALIGAARASLEFQKGNRP